MSSGNDGAKTVRADTVQVDTEGAVRAIAHRLTQADVAIRASEAETDHAQSAAQLRDARQHLANGAMILRYIAYGVSIGAQREIRADGDA